MYCWDFIIAISIIALLPHFSALCFGENIKRRKTSRKRTYLKGNNIESPSDVAEGAPPRKLFFGFLLGAAKAIINPIANAVGSIISPGSKAPDPPPPPPPPPEPERKYRRSRSYSDDSDSDSDSERYEKRRRRRKKRRSKKRGKDEDNDADGEKSNDVKEEGTKTEEQKDASDKKDSGENKDDKPAENVPPATNETDTGNKPDDPNGVKPPEAVEGKAPEIASTPTNDPPTDIVKPESVSTGDKPEDAKPAEPQEPDKNGENPPTNNVEVTPNADTEKPPVENATTEVKTDSPEAKKPDGDPPGDKAG
ncbi:uncharacterized protein BBOV_IV004210 [Babesia bovis T2Bo]|uniref:Membrane protein, putative n=1 Tax=Babesia bovis TaxID=5865 RepID=A7AQG3_BABBO|nr:uncharacterized protein BBOV_IV004210 [Babesia bovis T2Bo]EDO06782.1 putative integral membrane protein [Babesia bovis T2Bo]|eukprot:XP_001610350.1 hypothetical protein [Babesia bovis T2Bo]